MKKVLIIFFMVVIVGICYFLFDVKSENNNLRNKIIDLELEVQEIENKKEFYVSKQQELDELKQNSQDKLFKYEEVEEWNQEVANYLD